ncbi:MAG TPA: hypothetical protein VLB85_14350 [Acidimicrobiia bacterium]|nr:hypothetical protein [Acidimicrobiia bacterium]
MTLDTSASTLIVGVVAVGVAIWGTWFSVGSSRRGPTWAHARLRAWRPLPWVLGAMGIAASFLFDPAWVGLSLLYIAVVTGWLTRIVRKNLDQVRSTYGDFDEVEPTPISEQVGLYLLVGSVILAAISLWDVAVRGWGGVFGLVLAACLGGAGVVLRRAA